jgi:hypothetical protein
LIRDSAGVTITENEARGLVDKEPWLIDSQPILSIGEKDGGEPYQLYRIRGALRLEDGTVVLADASSAEIRFFDAAGRHLRSVGRPGEGPGEFREIGLLARYGRDSLMVWDAPLWRGTILAADGSSSRVFTLPTTGGGFVFVLDAWEDGSLLGISVGGYSGSDTPSGVRTVEADYLRFLHSGRVDTVGRFFDGQSFVSTRFGLDVLTMPFGFRALRATQGNHLYYGSSRAFEIRVFTLEGRLRRIVRLNVEPTPLTGEAVASFVAERLGGETDPDRQRRMRALYAQIPFPEILPAYGALEVDSEGNLWVGDYAPVGAVPFAWTIFDSEGRMLGRISTPRDVRIFEIGADYLLGVAQDTLGIERVELYRLRK